MTGLLRGWRQTAGGLRLARPGRTAVAVAARPGLWLTVLRLGWRTVPAGWWHRWPLVPNPPPAYVAFRAETMLGAAGPGALAPAEVVAYLRWCRRMRALGG